MTTVRAVLFDLDDTLFDHSYCLGQALDGIRVGHPSLEGRERSAVEKEYARLLEELHPQVLSGHMTLEQSRRERVRRLLAWSGHLCSPEEADHLAASYRDAYQEARRPVPGAVELLTHLYPLVTVGIVTNNLTAEQQAKMQHCGLERHIHFLLTSEDAGVVKPDPAIYRAAVHLARCESDEAVMVGDSWTADVRGALDAGLRAVWFNRDALPLPEVVAASELRSFVPVERALAVILGRAA